VNTRGRGILFSVLAILLTFAGLTPLIFRSFFSGEISSEYHTFYRVLLAGVPLAAVAFCHRIKIDCLPQQKLALFILLATLSPFLVYIHYIYIDTTSSYFTVRSNLFWQLATQRDVVNLNLGAIPHTYRFLPNSIVRLAQFFTGSFVYGRTLYWLTMMFLLLFSIYYYARLYCSHEKALLTVLFYAGVFPITIRYYAGQLTDPMSHLTFVLSFIFLEMNLFLYFALAILIGTLAKESIFVMAVYFLLFRRAEKRYALKTVFIFAAGAALMYCVRFLILPGAVAPLNDYFVITNLKGTWIPYLFENFGDYNRWVGQLVFTVGIFIPFLILAWKSADRRIKNLALFLLTTLLLSNMTFSWLVETRNLIPAVIPLALLTSDYLVGRSR
jgi:hypothetical protein